MARQIERQRWRKLEGGGAKLETVVGRTVHRPEGRARASRSTRRTRQTRGSPCRRSSDDGALDLDQVDAEILACGNAIPLLSLARRLGVRDSDLRAALHGHPDRYERIGKTKGSLWSVTTSTGRNRTASEHFVCTECLWRTREGDDVLRERHLHELTHRGRTVPA